MNDYYVYVYWRLDTNEPFYVGKGKGNRWRRLDRNNKHFIRIINKHSIAVEIIKNNLTEKEANDIECWLINELVFEYGYSIDIEGNRSEEKGCHLVNCTWGGEGASGYKHTEENKKRISKSCKLSWENEELKKKVSARNVKRWEENENYRKKMHEKLRGENNPMYGKHHSEETKKKMSEAMKGKYVGENNPMYGKNAYEGKTKEEMEQIGKKISEKSKGKNNGNAKSVICLTTKKIFYTVQDAMNEYNIKGTSGIGKVCKGKRKYCGKHNGQKLIWKYLVWKHNKKYRIKSIKQIINNI